MMKKAILVLSQGTAIKEACDLSIERIEADIAAALPDYAVRRAFTSGAVRRALGVPVDSPEEAIKNLILQNYKEIILVPTHIIADQEYQKVMTAYVGYRHHPAIHRMVLTTPLMYKDSDFGFIANLLSELVVAAPGALLMMAYGTTNEENLPYQKLQSALPENVYVACTEGEPSVIQRMQWMKSRDVRHVTLMPLMISAGETTRTRMAGDAPDSWVNLLREEGLSADCALKGLGELKAVRDAFVRRAAEAAQGNQE